MQTILKGLALGAALFSLASCGEPGNLGLPLNPGEDIPGLLVTDTFTVVASTILLDSVSTTRSGQVFAGRVEDPNFTGIIGASSCFELRPANNGTALADGAIADSLVLTLPYTYTLGDTTRDLTLTLHPLTERLVDSTNYYAFRPIAYDATTTLATVTFRPNVDDGVVRVRLDQLGQEIAQAGQSILVDNETFLNRYPGLVWVASADAKSMVGFELRDNPSAVLHYRTSTDNTPQLYGFLLDGGVNHYTNFTADRAGTPFSSLQNIGDTLPAAATGGLCMLQAGIGLRTVLKIPGLSSLKAAIGDASITKALLTVPVVNETEQLPAAPVAAIAETNASNRFLRNDAGSERLVFNDESLLGGSASFLFLLGSSSRTYSMGITTYVNQVVNGSLSNSGIILTPASAAYSANRSPFYVGSGPAGVQRLTLQVYYLPHSPRQ